MNVIHVLPARSQKMEKSDSTMADRVPSPADVMAYRVDAWQRGILFPDVMRQHAEQRKEHANAALPRVLDDAAEVVLDGRTLDRPVNDVLARILPETGKAPHPAMRPFVVADPRARHGSGIEGLEADSEIGAAMAAGHPCDFVAFFPDPVPVAGSPLSYWAVVRGVNPMRYTGALLGGSWLTALTGNLDAGRARADAVDGPRAARATPAPAPVRRSGPDPKDLP